MGIETYETTPGSNTALFPEGMPPSQVNDGSRRFQADVRSMANDIGWFEYGSGSGASPVTYLSSTSFRVPSGNHTAIYHVGRRVRAIGASTGTIYGRIVNSAHSGGNTDVTVSWDSGGLANETPLAISISLPYSGWPVGLANTDYAGLVELANAVETAAGTSPALVPTVASLGALLTAGASGRIVLPGGLMLQWGTAVGGDLVPFSPAYTTLYGVLATPNPTGLGFSRFAVVDAATTSAFVLSAYTDGGATSGVRCFWLAVGLA